MDEVFIIYVCEILGDTYSGLSGSEIVKYCVKYAVQYGVNIPHANYPFKEFAKEVPNKRTALKNNILAFNAEQQLIIIQKLCELPKFKGSNNVRELKEKLIKYGSQVINKQTKLDTSQNEAEITKKITDITYIDILDILDSGIDGEYINWNGRLDEVEFLSRLYKLEELLSSDGRFKNASEDIWQHTINNQDYELKDIFEYEPFYIKNGDDRYLLNFLCEIFHPAVRSDKQNWIKFLKKINELIKCDGYEMYEKEYVSKRIVYGWRAIENSNINCTNNCIEIKQDKEEVKMIEDKIFISHSSGDREYGQALVDLLRSMGLKREQIVFTSNSNYGIPLDNNIFDYLKSQIGNKVYMLYLFSDSYYTSVACLNEMGAAWMVQNNYTTIFAPDFNFQNPKFYEGVIDPRKMGFVIDDKKRVVEFKNKIVAKFNLQIDEFDWNEAFDKYIKEISNIKAEKNKRCFGSRTSEYEIACTLNSIEEQPNEYSRETNILNKDGNGFYSATIIEYRSLINKGIEFNCYKLNGIIGEVKVESGESHWLLYRKDRFGDFRINDKVKFKIQKINEIKSYNKGEKTRNIYVLDLYKI